ncbi:hypothetical protein HNQ55_001586 [Thalassotalea piscium]|uniref:Transposase IS204/IS1001/IS1096/IS1165 DDE domain-containing protein n=1 Tax=Thalassotalea piscium TaxID=1230533 RepID=A0A7X0NGQ0_9GAMM|nr:hypothetical protein [Thalassotalea piscium]
MQVAALEKKKHDDEACGEIETAHPGYLGSQDTFYVGNLKGVGRIYQQTFVDTYSKIAFAKLSVTKTPITAADMLNDKVLPYFDNGIINAYTESLNNLIKHLFRAGRGYSFDALRAKMLYGAGTHKVKKPKFDKRKQPSRDMVAEDYSMAYSTFSKSVCAPQQEEKIYLGVDLSTLTKKLGNDDFK